MKMANFAPILPQLNASEIETNTLFSQLGAKAIEYGFTAREVRGTTLRWLVVDAPDCLLPNAGPTKEGRVLNL